MARRQKTRKRQKPRTILRFPDLEQSKNAVVNWLTVDQCRSLLRAPCPDILRGKRNRAI
jgi:hypothetical protein